MEVTLGYSGVRQGTVADLDRMCITNAQRSAMRDFAKRNGGHVVLPDVPGEPWKRGHLHESGAVEIPLSEITDIVYDS